MTNPVLQNLAFQQAMINSVLSATMSWAQMWSQVMQKNAAMVQADLHRRGEDWYQRPFELPCGPCWTDGYGKREHDIDVEHDV